MALPSSSFELVSPGQIQHSTSMYWVKLAITMASFTILLSCNEEAIVQFVRVRAGLRFWNLFSLNPTTAVSTTDQLALESTHSRSGSGIHQRSLFWELASKKPQTMTNWKDNTSFLVAISYQIFLTCTFISNALNRSLLLGDYMNAPLAVKSLHSATR